MDATTMRQAVDTYLARQDRTAHPDGKTDNGGRWYPSDEERCTCCDSVRGPSRAYPWSYMTHCRTITHIANLFGVEESALRKAVRVVRPPKPAARTIVTRYKAVAVDSDGAFLSIFDGSTEYAIGKRLVQKAVAGHNGGYYVYATADAAMNADVPRSSVLDTFPRAILELRCEGAPVEYPGEPIAWDDEGWTTAVAPTKYAYSIVTPVAVVASLAEAT